MPDSYCKDSADGIGKLADSANKAIESLERLAMPGGDLKNFEPFERAPKDMRQKFYEACTQKAPPPAGPAVDMNSPEFRAENERTHRDIQKNLEGAEQKARQIPYYLNRLPGT